MMPRPALPIDKLLPEIVEKLRAHSSLVIEAPPGAGKTTRVPPALLPLVEGEVLVLEPRRLAVRMAARRVAQELGEKPGETVGYQVRFEDVGGARTRLRFVTEGVLTRRFLSDPQLKGVGAVVLDEFHERHLDGDFSLALLRRLQSTTRPGLKLIVMSATLDAAPIARYLHDCPVLRSEGKLHHLDVAYTPHSPVPLEEQVAVALEKLIAQGLDGDVLVFLPGAAEIRRAARAMEKLAARNSILIYQLYGDLSPAEQDRAVAPAIVNGERRRKVILSTNVAESSVTIEGVTAVIDSGLARVAVDSPWTGLPALDVKRISQASAVQRAGRAGRTAAGSVIRLYTADDFHRRPASDAPEIVRRELSPLVLQMRAMKIESLKFLDVPPDVALTAANALLDRLGFGAVSGDVTRNVAELPLPPRLAKLVIDAAANGAADEACAAAAVLSAGERGADLLALIDAEWQPETKRVYEQLRRMLGVRGDAKKHRGTAQSDEALLRATLAAYPDRVARLRKDAGRHRTTFDDELLLSAGGSARFPGCRYEFLIALDIEERREKGLPLVRVAAGPIQPEWLLDRATERTSLEWNRPANRVEQVSALLYDQLVIEETRAPAAPGEDAARLLEQKAIEAGIERFVARDAWEQLRARAQFAGATADPLAALHELCRDRTSFAELQSADFLSLMRPAHLAKAAPERLRLPGGREVKVNYEPGKPPWIESRLQDFFGVKETPRINGTPVVVHLLAPNRRPVQVTSDLTGFWERLYPQVRRELSRRYPKHKWPENP
jgi:ATP-dependent helicase HrpB